ncbi:MAG TPA: cation:proton antiporter [Candidatus Thermoplasmatota archaeon]|nr:cation:proton antiporter [Candidatus Thermoplasmatota archaeon]
MSELSDLGFVRDLAIVLVVAAVTSLVAHRTRQPVVLGYILAGLLVGPYLLPSLGVPFAPVSDVAAIETLAALGVVFLLFSIGLEFNLRKLRAVGGAALAVGAAEIGFLLVVGYLLGQGLGWNPVDSLFLGAVLCVTSTVVVVKIVQERGEAGEDYAQRLIGILLVEDIAAVVIISLLPRAVVGVVEVGELGAILLQFALFVLVLLIVGLLVVPRLVDRVVATRRDEVITLLALGLCLGGALLAAGLGLSVALGAFLLGALTAESRGWRDIEHAFAPVRNMFTAVFFVSIGMLVDTRLLPGYGLAIAAVLVVLVVAKFSILSVAQLSVGASPRTAVKTGAASGNIGEFSFVIASRGQQLGLVSAHLFPITVAVAALSSLVTPYLVAGSDRIHGALAQRSPAALGAHLSAYQAWLRARRSSGEGFERLRATSQRVAINAGIVVALLVMAGVLTRLLFEGIRFGPVAGPLSLAALWIVFGVLAIPSAYRIATGLRDLFAEAAEPRTGLGPALVYSAFVAVTALALAVALGLLLGPLWRDLPPLSVAAFVVSSVALASVLLWRALSRLHRHWEETLRSALGEEVPRKELFALLRDYPLDLSVDRATVAPASQVAYRTIGEIDLKRRTGATIAGVQRQHMLLAPRATTVVAPGDVLVLVGEPSQLAGAKGYLSAKRVDEPVPMAVRELRVAQTSALADLTLAATQLRSRAGVTVLALRRRGEVLANPDPSMRIEPDDVLIVLGDEEAILRAAGLVGAPEDKDASKLPHESGAGRKS